MSPPSCLLYLCTQHSSRYVLFVFLARLLFLVVATGTLVVLGCSYWHAAYNWFSQTLPAGALDMYRQVTGKSPM